MPSLKLTIKAARTARPIATKSPTFNSKRELFIISNRLLFDVGDAVDKAVHDRVGGLENLLGGLVGVNAALMQHEDATADARGAAHIVRDRHGGHVEAFDDANDQLI